VLNMLVFAYARPVRTIFIYLHIEEEKLIATDGHSSRNSC
jgi:hypothetical protein